MMGPVMTRTLGTPLTAASLLLVAGLVTLPGPAPAAPDPSRSADGDRVRLTAPPGEVVRSATVDLAGRGLATTPQDPGVTLRTTASAWSRPPGREPTRTSSCASATPTAGAGGATSSRWPTVRASPTGSGASDLLWAGASTVVQVRAEGRVTDRLDLVLIDPGTLPGDDDAAAGAAVPAPRAAASDSAPRPTLHSRKEWGADPDWRNGKPKYIDKLKQVHVHHTATGNGYSRADVPGILRGMYRYHTKTLGWFDIGYNFLVDRFGRAWVGRSGGADRLVRGAHTLGFNHSSVGIAMIGNLQDRRPWADAVTTLVKVASWKLDRHGRDAQDRVTVTSSGSDDYADGERVKLPVIDGHRDTNQTACPGDRLYGKLPEIRRRTQNRIDRW